MRKIRADLEVNALTHRRLVYQPSYRLGKMSSATRFDSSLHSMVNTATHNADSPILVATTASMWAGRPKFYKLRLDRPGHGILPQCVWSRNILKLESESQEVSISRTQRFTSSLTCYAPSAATYMMLLDLLSPQGWCSSNRRPPHLFNGRSA